MYLFQCLDRTIWKGILKVLLAIAHGLEYSATTVPGKSNHSRGVASAFHTLEMAHTHYWTTTFDQPGTAAGTDDAEAETTAGSGNQQLTANYTVGSARPMSVASTVSDMRSSSSGVCL